MKKTIAVIFGGKSAEHEVSILTAHIPIIPALKATGKFDVIPIYISEEGYTKPFFLQKTAIPSVVSLAGLLVVSIYKHLY